MGHLRVSVFDLVQQNENQANGCRCTKNGDSWAVKTWLMLKLCCLLLFLFTFIWHC